MWIFSVPLNVTDNGHIGGYLWGKRCSFHIKVVFLYDSHKKV